MSFKNSNLYGLAAVLALLLLVLAMLRRFNRGLLLLAALVAVAEKWRDNRERNRIRSILDRVD